MFFGCKKGEDPFIVGLSRTWGLMRFDIKGNLLNANDFVLNILSYNHEEVKGKHYTDFFPIVDNADQNFDKIWSTLRQIKSASEQIKAKDKNGQIVWVRGTHIPITNPKTDELIEVSVLVTDVTEKVRRDKYIESQLDALNRSQSIIEFTLDGIITNANKNFLDFMGYTLTEIKGKHHSLFVSLEDKNSNEYQEFWQDLRNGKFRAGTFCRVDKDQNKVWLQATYNPVFGVNNELVSVIKFAVDVTKDVLSNEENKKGLNECIEVLKELENGNLTHYMEKQYKGPVKDVKESLNKTIGQIKNTIFKIQDAVKTFSGASKEIAEASADLSSRTVQQASTIVQTASAMNTITQKVKENSKVSQEAYQMTSEANALAIQGRNVVNNTIEAMNRIEGSSKKILDIISLIDEVTFQTNLLALNAAVEAARAGEAGKGFAVVASEVKNLASRTSNASKEIYGLITSGNEEVSHGVTLVHSMGETLNNIIESVEKVTGMVSTIAKSSEEQASSIEEINTSINTLETSTQQNAAMVEESTAVAGSLEKQCADLRQLISLFKT